MSDLSIFRSLAPYHIVSYGVLLGAEFFQSFVGGIIAYQALPRVHFSQLQQKIFPIYFSLQSILPVALALTYPGRKSSLGTASGLSGTLAEANRWTVLAPIMTIFVTGVANFAVVGPATTKIMRKRKHQETRDGKKSYDPAPHSKEMVNLNRAFGQMHGVSSLLNLAAFLATLWYGALLSQRLN